MFKVGGRLTDNNLPTSGGCGVFRSEIIFAGGWKASPNDGEVHSTEGRAFKAKVEGVASELCKGDDWYELGNLNQEKYLPVITEVADHLYILGVSTMSFERYECTKYGGPRWSVLPDYPNYGGLIYAYAVAGGKLFVSSISGRDIDYKKDCDPSIVCFDPKMGEWRKVPTMCQVGPFPFERKALVLDLLQPQHLNKKLLFTTDIKITNKVVVYLMSLDENQESLTQIFEMNLPAELPKEGEPCDSHFVHLGGSDVSFVTTGFWHRTEEDDYDDNVGKTYVVLGAAEPFHFVCDISTLGYVYRFDARFMPPCLFKFHTDSDSLK